MTKGCLFIVPAQAAPKDAGGLAIKRHEGLAERACKTAVSVSLQPSQLTGTDPPQATVSSYLSADANVPFYNRRNVSFYLHISGRANVKRSCILKMLAASFRLRQQERLLRKTHFLQCQNPHSLFFFAIRSPSISSAHT